MSENQPIMEKIREAIYRSDHGDDGFEWGTLEAMAAKDGYVVAKDIVQSVERQTLQVYCAIEPMFREVMEALELVIKAGNDSELNQSMKLAAISCVCGALRARVAKFLGEI